MTVGRRQVGAGTCDVLLEEDGAKLGELLRRVIERERRGLTVGNVERDDSGVAVVRAPLTVCAQRGE